MQTLSDPLLQIERPMPEKRPEGRRLLMPLTIGLIALAGFVTIKVGLPAIAVLVRGVLTGDTAAEAPPFPLSGGWRHIEAYRQAVSTKKPAEEQPASVVTAAIPQQKLGSPRPVTPPAAMKPADLPTGTPPARDGAEQPDAGSYPVVLVTLAVDGAVAVPSASIVAPSVASEVPQRSESEPAAQIPRTDMDPVVVPLAEPAPLLPDANRSGHEITTIPSVPAPVAMPGTTPSSAGSTTRGRRPLHPAPRPRSTGPATPDAPSFRPFSGITALSP